jgi:hypothetical protein
MEEVRHYNVWKSKTNANKNISDISLIQCPPIHPTSPNLMDYDFGPARQNYSPHAPSSICNRCLSYDHQTHECQNQIRCRGCYNYGHTLRACLSKRNNAPIYRIKHNSVVSPLDPPYIPEINPNAQFSPLLQSTPSHVSETPSSTTPMANYPVDPTPMFLRACR